MGAKKDWLGMDEPGLLALIAVWLTKLADTGLRTAFKWPDTECVATISLLNTFKNAAQKYAEVPLKSNRIMKDEAKNAAKKAYLKELRRFIDALQSNPKMTDVIRADYNITIKEPRSKIGVPGGQVSLKLSYSGGLHSVAVAIEELVHKMTPDQRADYGVAIYVGLMPAGGATLEQAASAKHYLMKPPVSGDELKYDRFTRKKKEIVKFDPEDAGMTAYFCARYENQKGDAGDWGPIVSITAV